MGIVISFELKRARLSGTEQPSAAARHIDQATIDAVEASTDQSAVLAAARPLLERCRDRYGFVVMCDGLPEDPSVLGCALLELSRGLAMLDAEMGAPRTYPTFGVYFGRRQLAWFEDGYSGAPQSGGAEWHRGRRPRGIRVRPHCRQAIPLARLSAGLTGSSRLPRRGARHVIPADRGQKDCKSFVALEEFPRCASPQAPAPWRR